MLRSNPSLTPQTNITIDKTNTTTPELESDTLELKPDTSQVTSRQSRDRHEAGSETLMGMIRQTMNIDDLEVQQHNERIKQSQHDNTDNEKDNYEHM